MTTDEILREINKSPLHYEYDLLLCNGNSYILCISYYDERGREDIIIPKAYLSIEDKSLEDVKYWINTIIKTR